MEILPWMLNRKSFHLAHQDIQPRKRELHQSHVLQFLILPNQHILDSSKFKEFVDDNSKFDGKGVKVSKRVQNTMSKGENAGYEQFLLFPWCFLRTCTAVT